MVVLAMRQRECFLLSLPSSSFRAAKEVPSDRRRFEEHRFRMTRGNPSRPELIVGELDHITARNMDLCSLFSVLQVNDSDVVWPGSAFENMPA
jgi:hypothetical protein